MPKETIKQYGSHTITVGWEKEREAQIGIDLGSRFIFVDKDRKPLPLEDGNDYYTSLWLTLDSTDRDKFNTLIRALRKARDQVCGKDA